MELPLQSDTRWVCKLKAITTFKTRFKAVMLTLYFLHILASQLRRQRQRACFLNSRHQLLCFFLFVLEEILQLTYSLSAYCQDKQACVSTACALVKSM